MNATLVSRKRAKGVVNEERVYHEENASQHGHSCTPLGYHFTCRVVFGTLAVLVLGGGMGEGGDGGKMFGLHDKCK